MLGLLFQAGITDDILAGWNMGGKHRHLCLPSKHTHAGHLASFGILSSSSA